jgi:6-phosphofructokinase
MDSAWDCQLDFRHYSTVTLVHDVAEPPCVSMRIFTRVSGAAPYNSFYPTLKENPLSAKRIGILTGGGDVPGLNSVIKTVVYRASEIGCEVIGLRRGWEALTHVNLDDVASRTRYVQPLNRDNTRTIDRTGGTYLHSSRTNPSKMKKLPPHLQGREFPKQESIKDGKQVVTYDLTSQVLANLQALQLDYLIAIGGDDTLSYAATLDKRGVKVIAIPKTMDNDVRNTEYCIGFSTAISRATEAIERQRTTVGSHERIGVFRIFGRDAGYTALYTAYVSSMRCCIPEYKFDSGKLFDLLMTDKRNNPSNYALVVLSEGAEWNGHEAKEKGLPDDYGHTKKVNVAEDLSDEIQKTLGEETIVSDLTYDLRSGSPDFVDKMVASTFAGMAVDCIAGNRSGLMMAIEHGCYAEVAIPDPKLGPRKVDVNSMYNVDRYRPSYNHKLGLPIFLTRAQD